MADNTEVIILQYEARTAKATAEIAELELANKQAAAEVDAVNKELDAMPEAAQQAIKGVKGLGKAFKALLANPIVLVIAAVVGAVTALYSAFTRTASGGDTMTKIFDGLSAAMGPVLDSLGKLAQGIVSFLSGDFQKGLDQMSGSFDGIAESIGAAVDNSNRMVDIRRELLQLTRDVELEESRLNRVMDEQRAILDDASKSTAERIAANDKLNALNNERLANGQKLLDLQKELAQRELEDAGLADEEVQDAKNRLNEIAIAENDQAAELARIDKEFVVKRNELAALQLEQNKQHGEARIAQIQSEAMQEVELAQMVSMGIIQAGTDTSKFQEEQLKEEQARTDAKVELSNVIVNASISAFQSLSRLAGENFKLQKAFDLAGAIISTAKGVSGALGQLPFTPANFIQAGAVALAGAAQIATIARSKPAGVGGVGGGSVGGGGFTRPQFGSIAGNNDQFSNVDPNLVQNVSVVNQEETPPIRAFVMEGDQATQAEATKAADQQSTL